MAQEDSSTTDFKIKTAAKKAPLGMIPRKALFGVARVFQYGAKKYAPGNFLKATLEDGAGERYESGLERHLSEIQDLSGLYTRESLSSIDEESGLPHIDHAICGLLMKRAILIKDGVLPIDPGESKDPPVSNTQPKMRSVTGLETLGSDEDWNLAINSAKLAGTKVIDR